MANEKQLVILRQGVEVWNKWREENRDARVDFRRANLWNEALNKADLKHADLREADLRKTDLRNASLNQANLNGADLRSANLDEASLYGASLMGARLMNANLNEANLNQVNLQHANLYKATLSEADLRNTNLFEVNLAEAYLTEANLFRANLKGANLNNAYLFRANLSETNFNGADLTGADLSETNLRGADLTEANLSTANLREANLNKANISNADLSNANLICAWLVGTTIDRTKISGSSIYGISVRDLKGEFEEQKDLVITPENTPQITVDKFKIAQFIYLILNNEEIRDVFNVLTSKSVLILGSFALPERKSILDALRNKLREYNLLPIVFNFDRPINKDLTQTIKTLAGLSYFVIADVTNPKSSSLEWQVTVPNYRVPFVPIIQEGEKPFAMMRDLQKKYNWVLDTLSYDSIDTLVNALKPAIIDPAIEKHNELRLIKARKPKTRSAKDFLEAGQE